MHSLLAFGLVAITIFLLLRKPYFGVLFAIAAKPTIDTAWNLSLGGVSALELIGVALPTIILGRLVLQRPYEFKRVPGGAVWTLFIFANIGGFSIMLASGKAFSAVEMCFRVLNGVAGYYMLYPYIRTEKDFKRLLIAFIVAGLVPTLIGLYQAATGHVWSLRQTVGLSRNVGVYHDAFSLRSYGFMAMTGVILYSVYFAKSLRAKIFLLVYGACIGTVVFKVYSKAAVVIAVSWSVIWSVFRRRFHALVLIAVLASIVGVILDNSILDDVGTLFSKETAALEGSGSERLVLGGRAYIWEPILDQWAKADLFSKIFGMGLSGAGSHNDYIRVLRSGGLIALISYILLLSFIGIKLVQKVFRLPTPINIMALMIFTMWMIDTIGLTPGIYPGYQWYVWGFIALALRGIDSTPKTNIVRKNNI
jgi:hypothetical protein